MPLFLMVQGEKRLLEASDKVWGAVIAGQVSSPMLDEVDTARKSEAKDIADCPNY